MYHLSLVALGGAIGAGARHIVGLSALRLFGPAFPLGTLFINISGSLLMGVVAGTLAQRFAQSEPELRLFLASGVLGGYTTFSAFSLETVLLWERGLLAQALLYVAGSVALPIAALVAGLGLARTLA